VAITQFEGRLEHISLVQAERGLISETVLQTGHQIAIKLNCMHRPNIRSQKTLGQGTAARSHLQHTVGRLKIGSLNNPLQHGVIAQPVLAEAFAGVMSGETHGSTVHQHSRSTSIQRIVPWDGINGTRASLIRSSFSADVGCAALQQLIARAMRRRLAE
jgi:hypothetical protein